MTLPASIARLPERTPELAALLVRWADINSGSGHRAGLDRMRAALREAFGRFAGATIEELPCAGTADALRIRLRPQATTRLLFSGHFDTVYEANDAFQHCRWLDADRINGPGVTDMKGGLVTMLAALQAFEQTPHAANLGWEVLLTPDEEVGSLSSAPLIAELAAGKIAALTYEPALPAGSDGISAMVGARPGSGNWSAVIPGT